jgi:hypothetical protein
VFGSLGALGAPGPTVTPDKPAEFRNPVERRSTPVKRRAQQSRIQASSSSTAVPMLTDGSALPMLTGDAAPICLAWLGPKRKLSGISFCALRANVGPQGGPATTGVTSGDLLLALAGAHPRFTLDAPVAGYMRDLLKPVAADILSEWGLKPHQEDGYHWLMGRAARRLGRRLILFVWNVGLIKCPSKDPTTSPQLELRGVSFTVAAMVLVFLH